jgi:hydrogenase maturation protease
MMQTNGLAESIVGAREVAPRSGNEECCRCTNSCPCNKVAPVLLLALGNPLMSDDGAGQEILSKLSSNSSEWDGQVEFLDGGTQGLALLGTFEGRQAVVFLDAIRFGDKPGAVHVLTGEEVVRMGRRAATTAHEGSAPQILAALQLLDETPSEITLIGLEPEKIQTGIGLSPSVQGGLDMAAGLARIAVNHALARAI